MSLILFPAIDLKGGQVVRLAEGDMARATVYADDPAEQARRFADAGAGHLHVVDLDGAFAGRPENAAAVEAILRAFPGHVQLGGGIRNRETIERWFELGVARVVIGTAAVGDQRLRVRAVDDLGPELVVAVDARDGIVATHGWRSSSGIPVLELAEELAGDGVGTVLYTDVSRDGMDTGVALEQTAAIARVVPTIASGGVRGQEDVVALSKIGGVVGVVVGTALYEGRTTLEELLRAAGGS